MEDRWGTPPGAEDRLSALRAPLPDPRQERDPIVRKRRTLKEILLGLALVLVGSVLAIFFLGRSGPSASLTVESVPQTEQVPAGRVGKGMTLFAALVEAGSYPPAIREGDTVLVVVTPDPSADAVTRALPDLATVTDVAEASTISGGAIISMLGPETMSRDVADAAEIHLSIVDGER